MGTVQQAILTAACCLFAGSVRAGDTPRFVADDPLMKEPPPRRVGAIKAWDIDAVYDLIDQTFVVPRRERPEVYQDRQALNINTLGEVPDSPWYTNRHWLRRMSIEDLRKGPGSTNPGDAFPWRVVSAKLSGTTPGLVVQDARGIRFVVKLDALHYPEVSSAADVISSKFLYALGYNIPEDTVVRFRPDQLTVDKRSTFRDAAGNKHTLTREQVNAMLGDLPTDRDGRIRALSSRMLDGDVVGPFYYTGTRSDDPNDIVPHQDRRELRGLRIFYAWLNNTDSKAENSLDTVVEENGLRYIRHYLLDFNSSLGSDGRDIKDVRLGHEYFVDFRSTAVQLVTLGLYSPSWMRVEYPHLRGIGHFEASAFDPVTWKTNYPNPMFELMDREDAFWAAKQVASFTDDEIRAVVATGEYSDPRTTEAVARTLMLRRDRITRAYLETSIPLDTFRVEGARLVFRDIVSPKSSADGWRTTWSRYDNNNGADLALAGEYGMDAGAACQAASGAPYLAADIRARGNEDGRRLRVYVRCAEGGPLVIGLDRYLARPQGTSGQNPTALGARVK